ncbi:UvrD-helicase domain-containing protein [Legionella drancourtii]|uniref:DNA 3'-5' helicase n=1 Tax=Legionella drancourtii LLAP12 TaxID=658187 RepID=G9EM37_9GAMM|nr:UvrD-helicase domain-containing protein [Legionella drancourtii]EHL31637.1 ATP-dependent DNA helicase (UvrD/Rep helicase) [Legionella drancourtii LLAP12]
MLIDSNQRNQATDPTQSFIVQAPAGSGKTEILTQRYLRLLGRVTAPEQIIALTFTRKAASEMRERIIMALQQAANNVHAKSPHQQMTLDFAREALHRDAQYHWDLLHQPNRLKIVTIDALCQSINQAIPLLEKQIAYSQITDKAESHYLNSGRRCIQFAVDTPEYQQAIKTLLLHVDNRQDRLLDLFKTLLAQRDQWLAPLFQARAQEKSTFEHALCLIEEHELTRFKQSLPVHLATELTQCARELAVIENNPDSPRHRLKDWYNFQETNQDLVAALSKLLLTGDANFRKSFDHHVGLLSSSCPPNEYKRLKNASKELLSELNEYPDFLDALLQVCNLPKPEYDPEQWEVLQALFLLLPLLVGHLHLIFSEHNEIDFTAISQQALAALGESDCPTDLALYLDNSIHHLLVDEFQDTSITQFELLNKLVHGWQDGDGKTLFIVGDPMQSIYRFRQAEVGLFFRAKEQGIGPVHLNSLELSCNFRSTKTIVDWVNQQFSQIFPQQVDIESGAVSFHSSVNVIQDDEHSAIHAVQFKGKEQEAQSLIQVIHYELQTHPEQSMAILVRSRSQLVEIIRLLRQHQIPYQGTDITLLANLVHLRDVWSLTQALLSPANRLSWLSLLRSPYCGLPLADLHIIAQFNKKKSIYSALLQLNKIQGLSEEGRIRAKFFIRIMQQALMHRYESKLSAWVIATLKKLHADKILNQTQLNDLEQFWSLLDRYEQDGRLADMKEFLKEFKKLYSQQASPSRLQVMTIHKSKGLEFDAVFLPGLGAQPNRGDSPMLRWLNLPTQKQGNLLLMSPIQAAHHEHCAVYDYLEQLDSVKSSYETQRLLYVAVTRAKSRLYLMDHSEKSSKRSFRSLLKNQEFSADETVQLTEEINLPLPKVMQLPLHYYQSEEGTLNEPFARNAPSTLSSSIPRLIGIITHQLLQWICDNHPSTLAEVPWNLAHYEFKKLGFNEQMQAEALKTLQEQITRLFADTTGAWIIAKHDKEQNEYELLVAQQGKPTTRIIDRMFETPNKLWIIDFKTGREDKKAQVKHRLQLNDYALYLSERTELPIHCGIYYLSSNHWVDWQYTFVDSDASSTSN